MTRISDEPILETLPKGRGVRVLLDVGHRDQLIGSRLDRLGRPAALLTRRVVVLQQNLGRLGRRGRRGGGRRRRSRGRGREGVGVVDEGRVGGRRLRRLQGRLVPGGGSGGAVGVRRPVLPAAAARVEHGGAVGGGRRELVREVAAVDRGQVAAAARGRCRTGPESVGEGKVV